MWEIKKAIKKGDYTYALVPEHPFATKNGYVLYHRIIVENHLNRLLNSHEVVHHKNHNKFDNRIENLEVLDSVEHNRIHGLEHGREYADLKCPICGKEFSLPYNQTVYVKYPDQTDKAQCCSRSCGCKLGRLKQVNKITDEIRAAILENLIAVYTKHQE